MNSPSEIFIQTFHSIEGDTIAKRRRQFFTLLNQSSPSLSNNEEALNSISENLNPKTFLQQLLQVEFLIYFRRTTPLLELLKKGNDVFVSKIIKEVWFFQNAFDNIEANELVNEVLPNMSYVVRMKVLRKLSRYLGDEKFDSVFDAIVNRYGIFIATQFITGCSPQKIREVILTYPIILNSTQLRILYGKDPNFIDFYFSNTVKTHITSSCYKNLVKFLYNNDPNLFEYLQSKYHITISLGRRNTKKYFVKHRKDIVEAPHKFHFLNMKTVIRKLGKDSETLFINTLPESGCSAIDYYWMLRNFHKKYHYNLFFRTVLTHYKIKITDHPHLINESLLKLETDNSKRALLAKVRVDEGRDEFIKYLLIQDSIPLIKEKINLTSDISERGNLIEELLKSCHINDNLDALFSVMQYFCFRHKNDDLQVHLQFIRNIENLFGFKKFTKEMWDCLNELLTIHMLKFDQSETTYKKIQTLPLLSFNLGTSNYQKLSYLEFLFKSEKNIDELLQDYFTSSSEFPRCHNYEDSFVKYVLLFAIKNISKEAAYDEAVRFNCGLIDEIFDWNHHNKNEQLSFYDFPNLHFTFKHVISNNRWFNQNILNTFFQSIFTVEYSKYKSEHLRIYWQRFEVFATLHHIKWFLKYEPMNVIGNFSKFFNYISLQLGRKGDTYFSINYTIKKFNHLQLSEKMIQMCLSNLNDNKIDIVPCLALFMKPEDYAALAETYKPANKKLDLKNETEVRLYQLQCNLAKYFKYTGSYEVLPTLLHFCAGDYFKYGMTSLYSILYRTPENMLPQHLNYLARQAVSVRKHALYMTCELSTTSKVENMIRSLNKQEKVQSLQKYMFSTTIKYFVKNPYDPFFDLIKLNMVFIDKADEESLKSVSENFSKIPKKYQAEYFEFSWDYLEKTVDIWQKLSPLKQNLLRCLNSDIITQFKLEFGLSIIEKHFMSDKSLSIDDFIFNMMIYREEKTPILEKIFEILDKSSQDQVYQFLITWYIQIMKITGRNLLYMEPYVNYFEKRVSLEENFHDFIKIFFLKEKLQVNDNFTVSTFVSRIVSFFQDVLSKCGPHITTLFARELNANLSHFTATNITRYDIYYDMIKNHNSPDVAVLIMLAMSTPSYQKTKELNLYYKILAEIKEISDLGVQVNLYCKFKQELKSKNFLKLTSENMDWQ